MANKNVLEVALGVKYHEARKTSSKSTSPDRFEPENEEVARLQRDVRDAMDKLLLNTPFQEGRIVEVTFKAADLTKEVAHKLGGPAKGFFVVDAKAEGIPANYSIVRYDVDTISAQDGARAETHIKFGCTTTTSVLHVKIWVWR